MHEYAPKGGIGDLPVTVNYERLTQTYLQLNCFSWHEIGVYDLPAQINYILNVTQQRKLYYIGHSQGSTTFFVMTSERPEYNDKIQLMVAMAPAVFLGRVSPIIKAMARVEQQLTLFFGMMGINEFKANNEMISAAGQSLCDENIENEEVCLNMLFIIAGYDSDQVNKTVLPLILASTPAGSSVKQMKHYAQIINSGGFNHYDYGNTVNLEKYGSTKPPKYKLSRVTAPVALFYGKNDRLVAVEGVQRLKNRLRNVVHDYLIPYDKFNHLDFLWAKDVPEMVYDKVYEVLNKY